MSRVQVFDPPMCCSTGVCGPEVDPKLVRFAADLDWLKSQGVTVERYNLAQQPAVFVGNELVKCTLAAEGNDCLPLILVGGQIVSRGTYPARAALARFAGCENALPRSQFTPLIEELVAIGASIASNCMPCLKAHIDKARELGASDEDMAHAVAIGQAVKQIPAQAILELADRFLDNQVQGASQGCCTSSSTKCC